MVQNDVAYQSLNCAVAVPQANGINMFEIKNSRETGLILTLKNQIPSKLIIAHDP